MPDPYFLKTTRLGFRRWREVDRALALGLWGDPKVTQYIDARGKLSREQVLARLQQEIANQVQFHVQYWPLFLLATDEHIGCCGLRPYDMKEKLYEIGFHIRSNYWRRGYAFEAAQATISYAFGQLNAAALFAGHNPKNKGSRSLLEKLGFRFTHEEYYQPTGLYHPSYLLEREQE